MSLLKTIRQQLGLSGTGANNFTMDASADNGTMKLARGNAGATTQDILTVAADGGLAAGISPPQFDNDLSLATTEFVQAVGLKSAGTRVLNTSTVLGVSDVGKTILAYSPTAITLTLPPGASIPVGSRIQVVNDHTGVCTLAGSGADVVRASIANSGISVLLGAGETAVLEWRSANYWQLVDGTALDKYTVSFATSLATSGYQKLPSGIIVQWGVASGINNSAGVNVTFPIAFPTGAFSVVATHQAPGSGPASRIVETVIRSATYFDAYGNTTANAIYWMAIGR